jgi:twitching motility protein PilU
VVAAEILINTPLMADLIRKGQIHAMKELMARSRNQGMCTFDQALYDLYQHGRISYEDALASADSANDLRLMVKLGENKTASESFSSSLDGVTLQED